MIAVRVEKPDDAARVRQVNQLAFGQPLEASLVERLRHACPREGIGSQLVTRGLDVLRERGCPFVVVIGHPEYYPRFGFEPASSHQLASQWEGIPEAAFMVVILDAGAMAGVSGVARYRTEFDDVA